MNAMPPPALEAVARLRAGMWNAGFRPVALRTGDKMPTMRGWTERARRDPPADAEEVPSSATLNTGLLADGLRILDLDIDDAALVGRVRALAVAMLGETLVRTRGNSARCAMLYRAAEGVPPKRTLAGTVGKVEALGLGQQLHAFGPHPSGAALQWHPVAPGDATVDSLPAVTEAAIDAFLGAAALLIGAEMPKPPPGAQGAPNGHDSSAHGPTADPLDVSAALAVIPNNGPADWEHWNKVGMATWAATSGSMSGFAAWCGWSERHPKHDAEAARARWAHFTNAPPRRIGAGTLFQMARDARPGWKKPSEGAKAGAAASPDPELLANPDMSVLRLHRRPPPALPLEIFGARWGDWIAATAAASACPPDYVAAPLLSMASALIGNACWAEAWPGWAEPPHLWSCTVGDSGSGKSPGADVLLGDVLPTLQKRMCVDHPETMRAWTAAAETDKAAREVWEGEVRKAHKDHLAPPMPPEATAQEKPEAPRLRQNDVTIEKVAGLLASAAPKGLLVHRDELLGWIAGMNAYHDAGRAFWIEAYGGRPYRVERQKHPEPIDVARLVVAAFGDTQPAKVAGLLKDADDGLLGRICWFWPDPVPFAKGEAPSGVAWAIEALDHLRRLELLPGNGAGAPACAALVSLDDALHGDMEAFGQEMQARQAAAGGLMQSAYGKARGLVLRLSLVLTYLRWTGDGGTGFPPARIGRPGFTAATYLVADYLMPMAERVYGDAATNKADRDAATLARWIVKTRPPEVHVRAMQRNVRLPGLGDADAIRAAAALLVEAGWLLPPNIGFGLARKVVYPVNPIVFEREE